jgi:lipopolysaccharide transport system ATP-binding protein
MDGVVVRARGLSKRYTIGRRRHDTLGGAILAAAAHPCAALHEWRQNRGGNLPALDDVSFDIRRGEIVGIIGRNGAGKSTLLKILSRIAEPTSGRVDITGRAAAILEVGTGFHDDLTGRENAYLNGAILGMHKADIDRRFDEIVAFAGVEPFIDTPIKFYSSGMHMRLAFSVAAHLDADVLMIDEVLASGDRAFQNRCFGRIDAAARDGRTVLFVTHNTSVLERLATTAMLLERGRLVAAGPPRAIVGEYFAAESVDRYVASRRTGLPQFLTAHLVRPRGARRPALRSGEAIQFRLTYTLPARWPGLTIGISVLAPDGTTIFGASTADVGLALPDRAIEYEATVTVPPNTLVGGEYGLALRIWDRGDTYDLQEPALSFSIERRPAECPDDRRAGLVHVPCTWRVASPAAFAGEVAFLGAAAAGGAL